MTNEAPASLSASFCDVPVPIRLHDTNIARIRRKRIERE